MDVEGEGQREHGRRVAFAKDRDIDAVVEMIKGVREMDETCALGMLRLGRTPQGSRSDYYNHNVDTQNSARLSPRAILKIVSKPSCAGCRH